MKNVFRKKILKNITTFLFGVIILSSLSFSFAVIPSNPTSSSSGISDVSQINADGRGLVPDCAHQYSNKECTLQDLFAMIRPLRDLLIGVVILIVVAYAVYAGIMLAFYSDVPGYREKLKKTFKNGVIAIIILVTAVSLVFAALAAFGFNQDILNILKQIFAFNDFNIFPHALAQTTTNATTSNQYLVLFPGQGLVSLIQRTLKFLINYIVAPILTMGVIWAGFRFVKAEGNPEQLASAKKFATWMLIAIAVAVIAPLLLNLVISTVQSILS